MSVKPKKRSLTLKGHQTSVSLEDLFWQEFQNIAENKSISISALANEIDYSRDVDEGLASAMRDYILRYYIEKSQHNERERDASKTGG